MAIHTRLRGCIKSTSSHKFCQWRVCFPYITESLWVMGRYCFNSPHLFVTTFSVGRVLSHGTNRPIDKLVKIFAFMSTQRNWSLLWMHAVLYSYFCRQMQITAHLASESKIDSKSPEQIQWHSSIIKHDSVVQHYSMMLCAWGSVWYQSSMEWETRVLEWAGGSAVSHMPQTGIQGPGSFTLQTIPRCQPETEYIGSHEFSFFWKKNLEQKKNTFGVKVQCNALNSLLNIN